MQRTHDFDLDAALQDFRRRHPLQSATVDAFLALSRERDDAFSRACRHGHFTGSALVIDRSGTRALLTHHRKLDRWLQLGGHADGDRDLGAVALKEAREESGIPELTLEPDLFDIDVHDIPVRGEEAAHLHFDARFVVRTGEEEAFVVGDESHDLAWWDIAGIARDPRIDASLRRMATRWLESSQHPGGRVLQDRRKAR